MNQLAPTTPDIQRGQMLPGLPRLDAAAMWLLLPAHLRARDEESGGALRALLSVIAEQVEAFESHLDRFYADQFIETCDARLIPFIAALVGLQPLPDLSTGARAAGSGSRAEVANAIAARRRKGTAAMLEQVARDAAGWPCRLIECFQGLATTQNLNHLRLTSPATQDLRGALLLERLHGPFAGGCRTVELRRPDAAAARWHVQHVAVATWPIEAIAGTRVQATRAGPGRYRFSTLGIDQPLLAKPDAERDLLGMSEPRHVPRLISRLELDEDLRSELPERSLYGEGRSIEVWIDGLLVPRERIRACHLGSLGADDGAGWGHQPSAPGDDRVAIDPVLGRLAVLASAASEDVRVTWHRGLPARIGGGEYDVTSVAPGDLQPQDAADAGRLLDTVLDDLGARAAGGGAGVIRLRGSSTHAMTAACAIAAGSTLALRSEAFEWPLLDLGGGVDVRWLGDGELLLEGLLVVGGPLRLLRDGSVRRCRVRIRHCTFVPGHRLGPSGQPIAPGAPSLVVESPGVEVVLESSIVGPLHLHQDVELRAMDSVIDATGAGRPAICAANGQGPIGAVTLEGCTVIGAVHASMARLISNSILLAEAPVGWDTSVVMERRQAGCVRFSWLPEESVVPRRFRCLPNELAPGDPRHLSLRYGHPAYAMLHPACPAAILRAADNEGEPGVMHHTHRRRRLANAVTRTEEHLRAGFAAGLIEIVPRGGSTLSAEGDRFSDPPSDP